MLSRTEDAFTKTLIIASASYFEVRLTHAIVDLYRDVPQRSDILAQFVEKQAIGRRFAQLFDWEARNANRFYRLFGDVFSRKMKEKIRVNQSLDDSIRASLEIGNIRNDLVHGNYADFQLSKTADEVYGLYQSATEFVNDFPVSVRRFIEAGEP